MAEGDELAPIEVEEEPAAEDETLIEEVEEDSPDVAGMIDAPVKADEKDIESKLPTEARYEPRGYVGSGS